MTSDDETEIKDAEEALASRIVLAINAHGGEAYYDEAHRRRAADHLLHQAATMIVCSRARIARLEAEKRRKLSADT